MTICIAAISQNRQVFGACDRMMTSGDIEFEPDIDPIVDPAIPLSLDHNANPKIIGITKSIILMAAGDTALQTEIGQNVWEIASKRIEEQPQNWWTVREVVDLYVQCYERIKAKAAHSAVYAPFGLDQKTFLASSQLHPDLIARIANRIEDFDREFAETHGVETIIVGVDGTPKTEEKPEKTTPHIYRITRSLRGANVVCCDSIGFAAVGSGSRHAQSQFMLAGHHPYSSLSGTLLLTYLAKKRSEVAPGVGKGTDMFVIGPRLGTFAMLDRIPDFKMKKLSEIYKALDVAQRKNFSAAKNKTDAYISEMFNKRREGQGGDSSSQENS